MFLSRLADFPLEYAHALVGTSKAHLCPQRILSYRYEGPLALLYGASKPKAQPNSLLPKRVWPDAEKLGKKYGLCTCQTPGETVFVWARGQCQTDGGKAAVGAAGRLAWACSTQSPFSASCLLLSKVYGPSLSLCVSLLVQNIWKVERNSGAQDNRSRELCQGLDCPSFS